MQLYLGAIESGGTKTSVNMWECLRSSEEDGRTAAEYFLAKKPRPTAILATSDRLALGVMEVARSYQLRIPEDLAVVGFDDIPAARMSAPQLTTVGQPFEEKGRAAVAALLKEKGPLRTILPKSLIVRQSSDPAVLRADQGKQRQDKPAKISAGNLFRGHRARPRARNFRPTSLRLLTRINRLPLDWPHDRRNSITGIALGFVIYWNHRIRESLASV